MLKTKLLFLFFTICFAVIIVRLFYLQVLNSQEYNADYLQTRKIYPERGRVFDRNGQPLAVNQTTYKLFVEPKVVTDREKLIYKLDETLQIGQSTLEAKINPEKYWVPIKGNLSKEIKDKILSFKLPGVGFDNEQKRYYPEASLSAHLLGFVGKNNDGENLGYFGVEGFYDQELAGMPGLLRSERDLAGRPIFVGTQERVEPDDGRDIYLTIDKAVQNIVKKKLVAGMEGYGAKEGCVIVANPYTMELLSLVCLPDFDPTNYYDFPSQYYKNYSISNLYEPGSTFKPLVVAAAIQENAIKPDEIFDEDGPIQMGKYYIRTWDNKYHGKVNVSQILEKSSNVGMVMIGEKLGNDKLFEYINKYGFGFPTGVDLQGEVAGTLKSRKYWYPIDYATATFGQGIAVTPIQMIRAFSAIVNGGKLMKPYVVQKIVEDDTERVREPKVEKQIINERTSLILKKMLVSTVENGEFKWAKPKGFVMGGKTGTAQIAVQGKYDPTKTIASFIGFAPADEPKFIALVVLREPSSSIWGSETAAPLFFDIAKELLLYYNITPTKDN